MFDLEKRDGKRKSSLLVVGRRNSLKYNFIEKKRETRMWGKFLGLNLGFIGIAKTKRRKGSDFPPDFV